MLLEEEVGFNNLKATGFFYNPLAVSGRLTSSLIFLFNVGCNLLLTAGVVLGIRRIQLIQQARLGANPVALFRRLTRSCRSIRPESQYGLTHRFDAFCWTVVRCTLPK